MKSKYILLSSLFGLALFGVISCNKGLKPIGNETLVLPSTPFNYEAGNKMVNNAKATLGRVLFYDKQLSLNNTVSCGSCHKQEFGFADNTAFSAGLENKKTHRNTPAIQNLSLQNLSNIVFNGGGLPDSNGNIILPITNTPTFQPLFWDARESNLQSLMLQPVTNHIEMGITSLDALVKKLNGISYYKDLVFDAYGKTEFTKEDISDALANFNASIRTINTTFDKVVANQLDVASLKPIERIGMELFTSQQYNCSGCHASIVAGPIVQNGGSAYGGDVGNGMGVDIASFSSNIGLDNSPTDLGMGSNSGSSALNGRFRTPDLHNVALTAPYMHDGRFTTLDQVVGHYSHNIVGNANLDSRLKNPNGTPKQLNISEFDKKAIIAFLNTLTCTEVIEDPKFSNPFIVK
jgi:cytochrome c peroxidase